MKSSVGALLLGASAVVFDAGCKGECGGAEPSVLLELVADDSALARTITSVEVALEFDGHRYRKSYAPGATFQDGRTTLVVDLKPAPPAATPLTITVHASAGAQAVAAGTLDTTVQPNACNSFSLALARAQLPPDGGVRDADLPDSGPDGGVDPDLDGAIDSGIDGSIDGSIDGAVDGSVDGGIDGSSDASPDAEIDGGGAIDAEIDAGIDDFGARDVGDAADLGLLDGAGDSGIDDAEAGIPDVPPAPRCGDGRMDPGELCDDHNQNDGDGCDSNCTPTGCGNTIVTSGEECDDGNLADSDGCDHTCAWEPIRRAITVDNSSNTNALTNYPVLVTLDTGLAIRDGKMRSDAGDLRFLASNGTTPLDFWVASGVGTATTAVWVEVDTIPASGSTTVYAQYRDPSATSVSNGETTFLFFADFNASTLGDNGTQESLTPLSGSWSVVAAGRDGFGYEEFGTAARQSVLAGSSYSDVAVSVSVRLPIAVSGGVNGLYFRATDLNNLYFFGPFQQNGVTFGKYSSGMYNTVSEIVLPVQREVWHEITIAAAGSSFSGYLDGALMISSSDSSFTSGQIGLRTWGTNVRFDDLRVRPYRPPEPMITVGPEI